MSPKPSHSDDVWDDPGWKAYAKRCRDELMPMIQDSACAVSLVPSGEVDVKFAVELGFMIMLDKPIIAVVSAGSKVPLKLAKIADEIVEGDIGDPDFQGRFMAAMDRVRAKLT
jgi:nucleoside 2-deoxyribosyltransferase